MAPHATTVVSAEPRVISLYAEIKAIVRLHAHDTVAPPFSPAELAVMAWVCCRNYQEIIPERQIFRWAVKQFKFYANLAVEDAYNLNRYKKRERRLPYLQNLYNGIATEITLHNVPIYPVCIEPDSDDDDEPSTESPAYISTLPKARTFLRRALGNETSAFRRFLDLPAEIRLMIYAEVFRYEGKIEFTNPMLHLPAPRTAVRNTAYGREDVLDQSFAIDGEFWTLPKQRDNVTGLSGDIMSLLLVNQQIFQEAMPVFYSINTFQVTGIRELSRMLYLCGARRRVYITRIEYKHNYLGSRELTKKVFGMLGHAKQLQYFAVRTHDTDNLLELNEAYSGRTRWIEMLCDLKCQFVEVLGDCPRIKAHMQEYRAKKASADQQAEAEIGKLVKPSKRSKRVFKSEAMIHDD